MEKILKAFGILIILMIAGGVFYLYDAFYGNPLGGWLARGVMERYLTETYPDHPFTIQGLHYNFKCDCYAAEVTEAGTSVRFELGASPDRILHDEYKYTYLRDLELSERFTNQLREELTRILQPRFASFWDVFTMIDVPKDRYPADMNFQPGMEVEAVIQVEYKGEALTKAAFAQLAVETRNVILQAGYLPSEISFLYALPEKPAGASEPFLYSLRIPKTGFAKTAEQLEKDVQEE